jgi:DNA-binding GntR family transcriptional regulator
MRQLEPVRSKNELVYNALRTAIIQGDLAPGERLVIDDLAEQLGVSPIPVREALRHLEADGFVTMTPHVGAAVTDIHVNLLTEVFGLLEALEIVSGRAACERLSGPDWQVLQQHLQHMDSLVTEPEHWSQANVQFHQLICQRAGTPLVQKMMDKALAHWDRLRSYYELKDIFAQRVRQAHQQHWEMFNAIRHRDSERLERTVRAHNQAALAAYQNHLSQHRETHHDLPASG